MMNIIHRHGYPIRISDVTIIPSGFNDWRSDIEVENK